MTPPPSPKARSREAIFVNEDFDLFRRVLFYLYTEQITFTESCDLSNTDNATHESEAVYAIARRLDVSSLADKAAHFLKATTTISNISERTFGQFAMQHEDMQRWYDEYFMRNWDVVKRRGEFKRVFRESLGDLEEYIRITMKFQQMIIERD